MPQAAKRRIEVGLVLQGGGALGAYEYGAITALLELTGCGRYGMTLRWKRRPIGGRM
jgi:predicted acylesterase/phospholipase RssA